MGITDALRQVGLFVSLLLVLLCRNGHELAYSDRTWKSLNESPLKPKNFTAQRNKGYLYHGCYTPAWWTGSPARRGEYCPVCGALVDFSTEFIKEIL